jgi:solute:Na+ symporter, SSS family
MATSAVGAPVGIIDIVVIIVYLAAIVGFGCWVGVKRKKAHRASDYFLAGKSLRWPVIGLALFATNISCVHLVSLAQAGFDSGLLMGNFEWMAAFTLVLLGFFFAPFYIRARVTTLPDFLEKRYCRECRDWLSVLSIIAAIAVHIGFALATGAVVLHGMFGIDEWVCVVTVAALTGRYTIIGGLTAVVVTESIQTVVLLTGATVITVFAYIEVGGWSSMVETLDTAEEAAMLSMLSPGDDPHNGGLPWYAVFLGYPVLGIWYWCADQTIVQRVLGARDVNHARLGPLFAELIKVLPVFIFVLPGLLFYAIIDKGIIDMEVASSKDVYALMIKELLPVGLTGVMAAALMAALMSTVSGAINSISILFSYDLYRQFRPDASERRLVFVGRLAAFLAMIIAIALVPLLDSWLHHDHGAHRLRRTGRISTRQDREGRRHQEGQHPEVLYLPKEHRRQAVPLQLLRVRGRQLRRRHGRHREESGHPPLVAADRPLPAPPARRGEEGRDLGRHGGGVSRGDRGGPMIRFLPSR